MENEKFKVNIQALRMIRSARGILTKQQERTLRGQVLAGDSVGALKGLNNIIKKRKERRENEKHSNR